MKVNTEHNNGHTTTINVYKITDVIHKGMHISHIAYLTDVGVTQNKYESTRKVVKDEGNCNPGTNSITRLHQIHRLALADHEG